MRVTKEYWGEVGGERVHLFTLSRAGIAAKITNYGGILSELHVPDARGDAADVVLGLETLEAYRSKDYIASNPYFGALIGRVANRVAGAQFSLGKETYPLAANEGNHHLHGGERGFDKRVWQAQILEDGLALHYLSPHKEEGYPGTLEVSARYTLLESGLRLELRATTDRATPVNLTQHTYWNLAGEGSGNILNHDLTLNSRFYTWADDTSIPTGEIFSAKETPFDFQEGKSVGADIEHPSVQRIPGGGYDTNFILTGQPGDLRLAARLRDPTSGRKMELHTTQPGLQVYSGNFLDGALRGKSGAAYPKHAGVALEPQAYPDAVNIPHFPSAILQPDEVYHQVIEYRFSAE